MIWEFKRVMITITTIMICSLNFALFLICRAGEQHSAGADRSDTNESSSNSKGLNGTFTTNRKTFQNSGDRELLYRNQSWHTTREVPLPGCVKSVL